MRMWMISPDKLCNRHLLGEHGEIHKFRHNFVRGTALGKRISPVVQIEPAAMGERHDALVTEMLRRGMNHHSPYEQPDLSHYPPESIAVKVNVAIAEADLCARCPECRRKISEKEQK